MLFLPALWYRALRQFDPAVVAGTTGGRPHVTCPKYAANTLSRVAKSVRYILQSCVIQDLSRFLCVDRNPVQEPAVTNLAEGSDIPPKFRIVTFRVYLRSLTDDTHAMTNTDTSSIRQELAVLWLQSGGCGGCTLSLLGTESPDLTATTPKALPNGQTAQSR
jgi:hypothetical protein